MAHQSELIEQDILAYLKSQEEKSLLRFITCGSVDDGKSTLIGRLLWDSKMVFEDQLAALEADSRKVGTQGGAIDYALLLDGLQAEREQGITIDVAYRYFSTDLRKFIVADTPGHEQYTRNMVTGASTAQVAVILVDARKGLLTQTRRHSFLVSLVGIRHIVLAINKMDLIDFDEQKFEAIHRDYLQFAVPLGFASITAIPLSALNGDNMIEASSNLPFVESLKPFKIWMDGMGPFPDIFHPGLRLEDKWIQYQLIQSIAPMPETMVFDPQDLNEASDFQKRKGKLALKRRLGRGGRNFKIIPPSVSLSTIETEGYACLLQEYIESKVNGYTFSIRSVAFAGEFMCMYANLSNRSCSNHGFLTFVSEGKSFGLSERAFRTESFNQKSWEAGIWFGEETPPYLQHNLYEDEVAQTTLYLLPETLKTIKELSVRIERFYEGLDFTTLPKACFEEEVLLSS